MKKNYDSPKKRTGKQIAAWICIGLLLFLYIFTFIVAMCDFPGAANLFRGCLMLTFTLPILLWIYIWMYGKLTNKETIADLHLFEDKQQENAQDAIDKKESRKGEPEND